MKSKNVAEFSELFAFAEKEFGVHWNASENMFFQKALPYSGHIEFSLRDAEEGVYHANLEEEVFDIPWYCDKTCEENWATWPEAIGSVSKKTIEDLPNDSDAKAYIIIVRFIQSLKVNKLLILCS